MSTTFILCMKSAGIYLSISKLLLNNLNTSMFLEVCLLLLQLYSIKSNKSCFTDEEDGACQLAGVSFCDEESTTCTSSRGLISCRCKVGYSRLDLTGVYCLGIQYSFLAFRNNILVGVYCGQALSGDFMT